MSFCRMPIAQEVMAEMSNDIGGIKASTQHTAGKGGTASMKRGSRKGKEIFILIYQGINIQNI